MIPVRVELTDFLSHRRPDGTPAVFDFEGAKLWSVSGDNGAGKSAIFDGITWTLYGMHRGGRQDSRRLISHGADGCVAAFVFDVGGRRYRVERSLRRRGSPKRRAQAWDADAGAWTEIPDTSSEAGFGRWRDELVGLSYAAFTHSVLLLQGRSDALISTGAKDRFEVLAQLVDLSRYQRLEQLARERSSELAGRRRLLAEELEGVEPVRADERRAAEAEAARLEAQQERFARVVEERIEAMAAARLQAELGQRLEQARERIAETGRLVVDADAIRIAAAEHAQLTAAGAKLRDALESLAAARAAQTFAHETRAVRDALDLERLRGEAEQTREAATVAVRAADEAAARASTLEGVLPAVAAAVERRVELSEAQADVEALGTVADLDEKLDPLPCARRGAEGRGRRCARRARRGAAAAGGTRGGARGGSAAAARASGSQRRGGLLALWPAARRGAPPRRARARRARGRRRRGRGDRGTRPARRAGGGRDDRGGRSRRGDRARPAG